MLPNFIKAKAERIAAELAHRARDRSITDDATIAWIESELGEIYDAGRLAEQEADDAIFDRFVKPPT